MSNIGKHRRGIVGTILFHGMIILLLLFFGFVTPLPLPEERGILVDFGNSATGSGAREPARRAAQAPVKKEEKKKGPVVTPPPVNKPNAQPKSTPNQGKEKVLTQDFEESAAVNSGTKKSKVDEKKKREEELARRKKLAEEKARQEEQERERQAELERQRKAAAERKKREEEQRQIAEINSRAQSAFGGGKADNGPDSKSQGVTYGGGNQGSPDGSPGANRYGNGGGSGNTYNLSGRSLVGGLPKPDFPGNEEGTVVVEITVDKYGKVTQAVPGIKGSNTMNPSLLAAAKKAALSARFNTDNNASAFQKGTITYHFVLD
ncbi:cell envelope integrity protein TolA [Prolixibacter sp. SD074]|uniref:cell envelope integrity protein TolA n=1 Tax=Prolixibacter sp. SD074 TaxID=2652391 RepID=UPI00127A396C|nr:cell envelope integrity protein TolA [Prolixibacter sp. SD074]GET29613.1 cell envelope biogenesis protein TonB [Prolixibacter sp. SD074]